MSSSLDSTDYEASSWPRRARQELYRSSLASLVASEISSKRYGHKKLQQNLNIETQCEIMRKITIILLPTKLGTGVVV
jgi:hypothetical protein